MILVSKKVGTGWVDVKEAEYSNVLDIMAFLGRNECPEDFNHEKKELLDFDSRIKYWLIEEKGKVFKQNFEFRGVEYCVNIIPEADEIVELQDGFWKVIDEKSSKSSVFRVSAFPLVEMCFTYENKNIYNFTTVWIEYSEGTKEIIVNYRNFGHDSRYIPEGAGNWYNAGDEEKIYCNLEGSDLESQAKNIFHKIVISNYYAITKSIEEIEEIEEAEDLEGFEDCYYE